MRGQTIPDVMEKGGGDKVRRRADKAWSWGHVEGKKKSRRAKANVE